MIISRKKKDRQLRQHQIFVRPRKFDVETLRNRHIHISGFIDYAQVDKYFNIGDRVRLERRPDGDVIGTLTTIHARMLGITVENTEIILRYADFGDFCINNYDFNE